MGDHTEAVAIDFDPSVISYQQILKEIWQSHDPLRNYGSAQYRHAIWYSNNDQKADIESTRDQVAELLHVSVDKIATDIEPASEFTYAEDYHQKYSLRMQRDLIDDLESLFVDYLHFTDSTAMTRLNGWFGNRSNASEAFRNQVANWELPDSIAKRVLAKI